MSFWSKLGLADAAAMAELKEEILSLRQENEKLHEAQSRHTQQQIQSACNAGREHMMCQVSAIMKNQESFKESISSITTSRDEALTQIITLLNAIKTVQDETSSKLCTICHGISGELASLKGTAQTLSSTSEKMAEQLDSGQIGLQKILVEAQDLAKDISFLKKYTESLWEAMKLVWINDLLDDAKRSES